ncbi:hypothetical protein FA15DRAFT_712532 [Coprinopsis marcescibilis]|uniref:Uncharacterized protein n=1 Tax=Coprinopsis marcescibilis TaxID=230819 RepID=A0A5C3LCI8_COPMA|nr:hypothetical protein FA15DRAFT_712532 [Coprinopsis marcescibilis]
MDPSLNYSYPNYNQVDSPAPSSTSSASDSSTSYAIPSDNLRSCTEKHQKSRTHIAHPYARLVAKKDEVKRRKIWNHALEKYIFSPYEISTIGAPQRRVVYIASLENHIDELHTCMLLGNKWPVPYGELDAYKGLNSKTAKSMVAGLQHDSSQYKLKLLELERANTDLEKRLRQLKQLAQEAHY